jgi:hypothetical protein
MANAGPAACREPEWRPADELSAQIRRDTRQWRVVRPALVAFLLIVGAGVLLGALAFVVAGSHQAWPTSVGGTATGWRVSSPDGLTQNGLAPSEHYLVWTNGGCLELLDLRKAAGGGPTVSMKLPSDDLSTMPVTTGGTLAWTHDKAGDWPPEVVIMRTEK